MKQIKKKIDKDARYDMTTFKSDMHLLWDNARMYNVEGSWVYVAADDMQEQFDKAWQDELDSKVASAVPGGLAGDSTGTATNSGTSTPMYKPTDLSGAGGANKGIGKIKLNMGTSKRREMVVPDEDEEEDEDQADEAESKVGQEDSASESEEDDDY